MADSAISAVFKRPFAEQLAFFRAKMGNLLPSQRWDDVWKSAHDTGFMVAGATKADLLADFAGAVEKAIATGTSLGEFRKDFDNIVAKYGWSYTGERNWRSRVIYQTNISTSYAAGREAQITAAGFPFKMYKHSDSVMHPRPLHESWDGLVLPIDHPFWETHSTPNGWGCKCRIIGIRNQSAARRLGGKWGKEPPAGWDDIDAKTGEPVGIDKGWGYQPGASVLPVQKQIKDKAEKLPEQLGAALAVDIKNPPFAWDTTTRAGQWHQSSMDDAPEYLKKAFVDTGDFKVTENARKGSYCNTGYINMSHPYGTMKGASTWRHEFGHRMDATRANKGHMRSMNDDFTNAMNADADAMKTGSGLGRKSKSQAAIMDANRQAPEQIRDQVVSLADANERSALLAKMANDANLDYQEFQNWFSKHTVPGDKEIGGLARQVWEANFLSAWKRGDAQGLLDAIEEVTRDINGRILSSARSQAYDKGAPGSISDLFSAASGNKIEGCGGHTLSYYKQRAGYGRQAESWANIVSVIGTGPVGEALLQAFTPGMFSTFKGAL